MRTSPLLLSLLLVATGTLSFPTQAQQSSHADFVHVHGPRLEIQGRPYHYVGANFWSGMNLGSTGPGGDRARLLRELDRLKQLGIDNLRVLAASEGPNSEPWRIIPALQTAPGIYDEDLLNGLDFLLSEMGKRHMHAVMCLNNFWPWSGGMSQYLKWFGAGSIPYPPPQPGGSWSAYQDYTAQFYLNEAAMKAAENHMRAIITRTNRITGRKYSDDPTVMSWQLANEPRGNIRLVEFDHWLERTSNFIKGLDPDHLVTTGSEGETPFPRVAGTDFLANHRFKSIDYATAHIWAQNWDWFDPTRVDATYGSAVAQMKTYFRDHVEKAKKLGKPLVIEEFGLSRDEGSYNPEAGTLIRDRYFSEVFAQVYEAANQGEPVAGVNFWAWAGEARPLAPFGGAWKTGDPLIGDPPHEAQGWYSVYDGDVGTQAVISKYAGLMRGLGGERGFFWHQFFQ